MAPELSRQYLPPFFSFSRIPYCLQPDVHLLKVLKHWGAAYSISLKRPYIFGHFEIDAVGRWYCPGRPFFDQVLAELAQGQHGAGIGAPELISEKPSAAAVKPTGRQAAPWYRVVAGSYRSRATADREAARLRAQGIDAFIVPYREPS